MTVIGRERSSSRPTREPRLPPQPEVEMYRSRKSWIASAAGVVIGVMLAAVFTGSVLGVEGRLPKQLPEAVTLAVTSPVSTLPAARHRH